MKSLDIKIGKHEVQLWYGFCFDSIAFLPAIVLQWYNEKPDRVFELIFNFLGLHLAIRFDENPYNDTVEE